jgi:gliding motility-associated-like protein
MKTYLCLLFCFFCFGLNAQPNLVPNPSFEDYKNCPFETTVLDSNANAFNWFGFGGFFAMPVYYNSCSNPLSNYEFGVPYNNWIYQPTKTGNAYVAFYPSINSYNFDVGLHNTYLGIQLVNKCIKRLLYFGKFYCAATDYDPASKRYYENGDSVWRLYSISNLAMYFGANVPNQNFKNSLVLPAQIKNKENNVLSDTVNWMEVSGKFEANGDESFLTLGCFDDSSNTKFYNTYGYPEPWLKRGLYCSIYFIDDVSLIPQNTTHYYDSILCSNAPLQLGAVAQADSFEWHDGNKTDKLRHFTQPGLVWVKSWLYGGTVYMWDSINIINQSISTGLPKDTFFCFNQPYLTLTAAANNSYLWHNGSLVNSLLVNGVDLLNGNLKVWLTVTKNTCTLTDTVSITQKPAIQIPITDTTTCFEDVPQILLDAGAKFKTYLWQPTGEITKTVYSQQAQIYNLTVTDSFNCTQTKSIAVDELCKAEVFIPNAFTPNSDNLNDTYKPIFKTKNLLQYEFKIFDSWGNEVFTSTDPTKAWDAKNSSLGVYVVLVNYQYKGFLPQIQKGTVTLLR